MIQGNFSNSGAPAAPGALFVAREGIAGLAAMAQADLSFLSERVQRALAADEEVLGELRRFDDDYADLQRLVRDLPNRTSHEVMVPFTDVAFFPGRLIHTNELLVLLGSDLYAERSATQTLDIIERRRDMLREKIQGASARVDAMSSRVGALDAVSAADGGLGVIPEEEGEDDAPARSRPAARAAPTSPASPTARSRSPRRTPTARPSTRSRRARILRVSSPGARARTRFRRRDGPTRGARGGRRRRPASARAGAEPKPPPRRPLEQSFDASTTEREMDSDDDSGSSDSATRTTPPPKKSPPPTPRQTRAPPPPPRVGLDDAAAAVRRRAAVKNVVEERRIDTRRTDATIDIAGSAASAPGLKLPPRDRCPRSNAAPWDSRRIRETSSDDFFVSRVATMLQ